MRSDCGITNTGSVVKGYGIALGQASPELSQNFFIPVLPEPDHLVNDPLEAGEDGGVEVALHVHDLAAHPHGGSGLDGTCLSSLLGLLVNLTTILPKKITNRAEPDRVEK